MDFNERKGLWVPEAPMLALRPTIETRDPVASSCGLEGWISWELTRRGEVIQSSGGWYRNLIVDAGLNALAGGTIAIITLTNYCSVGTGTNAPANGDVVLQTPIAPRTNSNGGFADTNGAGASDAYRWWKIARVFTESQVNGNLNEVGFFSALTGGTMFNRQRLKDINGEDVTITKTDQDQLHINLEWRAYPDQSVRNQSIVISGVTTSVDNRALDIDGTWVSFPGNIGTILLEGEVYTLNTMPDIRARQAGTGVTESSGALQTYGSGNFYRDLELKWEPATGNAIGPFGSLEFWGPGTDKPSQIATFDPKIAKDATRRVTIMVRCHLARRP